MIAWTTKRRAVSAVACALALTAAACSTPQPAGGGGTASANPLASPRALAGIALGTRLDAVQARCAGEGWTCVRRARTVAGHAIERLHVTMPSGEFARAIVVAKGGTVIGVRATYRAQDATRATTLTKVFGSGAKEAGVTTWTWPGTRAELSRNGAVLVVASLDAAKAVGFPLAPRLLSRVAGDPRGRSRALTIEPQLLPAPIALAAPENQRIDVTMTLDSLTCIDEDDPTSIFWGDDPYVYATGQHTAVPQPWPSGAPLEKHWSDVESGDTLSFAQPIFAAGDSRRSVTRGEAVAFHAALFEADTASFDDEIDFVERSFSFDQLRGSAGQTLSGTLVFEGDGAKYSLAYHVTVGQPVTIADPPSAFGHASAQPWAGAYAWNVDGRTGTASLQFTAPSLAFPDGQLDGTWLENGQTLQIRTQRLIGNYVDFKIVAAGQTTSQRRVVGYLVGAGDEKAIAGTSHDGAEAGFFMRRTP